MHCAAIFDWDGTLADSKKAIVASFQKVFQDANIVVSNEFIERRIGIGSRNLIIDALKTSNVSFSDKLLNTLLNGKIEAEIELTPMVELFDGAIELLNTVCGKMKTALASMNNRTIIDRLLDQKGIRKYFDVVLVAEDVTKAKPDPEIFLKAATGLLCAPKQCVVLEDSIFGVKSAKAARMKCIAIASGTYSKKELKEEKPDLIVNSLKETRKISAFLFG
jgi:beta-phosphoglucomutase-like phosphatase (HAD superfamily)